jgi:hypothetical protein
MLCFQAVEEGSDCSSKPRKRKDVLSSYLKDPVEVVLGKRPKVTKETKETKK